MLAVITIVAIQFGFTFSGLDSNKPLMVQNYSTKCVRLKYNRIKKETDTLVYSYKSSDFPVLVSTKYYIDKSLMIRDLFDNSSTVLVTAPNRFGKTVNIDMIRRFLEIAVDVDGNEIVDKTRTNNYKMFTNLKIYKEHRELFDRHFGNHPVIFIDYAPLALINSFDDLLETYLIMIHETYQTYSYLLDAKDLWGSGLGKEMFKDYVTGTRPSKFLMKENVIDAFLDLSRVLFRRYNRPVFVLIDDYDAYFDNMIFQINANIDNCVELIRTMNSDLIKAVGQQIGKIFLTGVLRVTSDGVFLPENVVQHYPFMYNHKFRRFYGLTDGELKNLLVVHTNNNETAIDELKRTIVTRYRGYTVLGQKYDVYNMRSVMKYLVTGKEKADTDLKNFINFFYFIQFRFEIVRLLQNGSLNIYTYEKLSRNDVVALRGFHDFSMKALPADVLDLSLYLLLELGFLTIKKQFTEQVVTVRIPSLELEAEFAQLLLQSSISQYELNVDGIKSLNNIINSISEEKNSDEMFGRIFENIQHVFFRSMFSPEVDKDFECILFSLFRWRFRRVYAGFADASTNVNIDVWLKNDRNVTFIIEAEATLQRKMSELEECAQKAIDRIIRNEYVQSNFRNKVVYLGFCYSGVTKEVKLRYSKLLNEGDSVNKTSLAKLPFGINQK